MDGLLLGYLQREDVGVVGARLLYPDHTIQHVGIIFGHDGAPRHEGVGAAADDPGPLGRWQATRAVGAVTGAFLGVRATLLDEVGGFDQRLFIGYNDIDFCLRIRATGRSVLYTPVIELTHFELKTRGLNNTRDRLAWDQSELAELYRRWGRALVVDRGYNPHWSRHGQPFEWMREPPLSTILEHLDQRWHSSLDTGEPPRRGRLVGDCPGGDKWRE